MAQKNISELVKFQGDPVVQGEEFPFAAVSLEHGHIYDQCRGLIQAGAMLKYVYDEDPKKVAAFCQRHPTVIPVQNLATILEDPTIRLVASAAVPCNRAALGIKVMRAGKDYFTAKTPFTDLHQLAEATRVTEETGRKYLVFYGERLYVESALFAGELIHQGHIGRVIQVVGVGPHRLFQPDRPNWFFKKAAYGGILCDIGSHQVEQFLHFTGATEAEVTAATIGNFAHPEVPEFEDFGTMELIANNGASAHVRVDWLMPEAPGIPNDGRTTVLGTEGYIEIRKYVDPAGSPGSDHLVLVNREGIQRLNLHGQIGLPFFGQLIRDCLNRTEVAMTQRHIFKASEISLKAQAMARRLG